MLLYLVIAVVCLLPGGLLGFVVPPGPERWIAWAAAPILTLGLTAAGMAWLPAVGLSNAALWVLGAEMLLAVLVASGSRLVATRTRSGSAPAEEPATAKVLATAAPARVGEPAPATQAAPATRGRALENGSAARAITLRNWLTGDARRPWLADLISVAIPLAVAVFFGRSLLGHVTRPPGWDAMNHGLFTRNIIEAGTTTPSAVCTTGPPMPEIACHFYPLGPDVSWAQTAVLTGGHISTIMLAWSALIGPVALVLAVYAAVRTFGGGPLVAGCAAIIPVILSPMWPALLNGRPPEAFAPGMSVAVALLATRAIRGKYPVRFGFLAGLGIAGVLITHTYDVLFAAVLALIFLVTEGIRLNFRTALTGIGATAFGALAAGGPLASALLSANGERSASRSLQRASSGIAWHFWVTDPSNYVLLSPLPYGVRAVPHIPPIQVALWLTLPFLVASPLCFVIKELRWARPWLLTLVAWTALGVWTSVSSSSVSVLLSGLWYGLPGRLRTMALPVHGVLVVAGAYAIGVCLYRLAIGVARRERNLRLEKVTAGAVSGLLAVSLVGLAGVPGTQETLVEQYRMRSPAGDAYTRVFEWLAHHTPPGKVVAYNRNVDFLTWSYADYGVAPLFGIPPLVKTSQPDYDNRWQAWGWLIGSRNIRPAGCLVRKYGIEYVVTGDQHLPVPKYFPRDLNYRPRRLAASPNVTLVHSDNGLLVYQVTKAGMACPS